MVIAAHICEYTKNHLIVHFQWVSCVVCKSYLTKNVKKKQASKPASLREPPVPKY